MPWLGSLPMAVETKTRLPHTMGLETATPPIGVFHATFCPEVASHFTAVGLPSATPDAFGPRNEGQFCADSVVPAASVMAMSARRRMLFALHARVFRRRALHGRNRESGHLVSFDAEHERRPLHGDAAEGRRVFRDQREPLIRWCGGRVRGEARAVDADDDLVA